MKLSRAAAVACVFVLMVGEMPPVSAQRNQRARAGTFDASITDPMSGPLVTGAPFSAEATTTVTQTLGDGTRIEQRVTAKFYRDGTGRVRREQTIIGMDALNPSAEPQTIITVDTEPGSQTAYILDPVARTARRVPRAFYALMVWNVRLALPSGQAATAASPVTIQGLEIPQRGVPADVRTTEEMLGTRQIEGVRATGVRTTTTIPADRIGNDRPILITDERWESADLKGIILSRFSDPRTGVIEFKLANITRAEPSADLFSIPADYTLVGVAGGVRRGGPALPRTPDGTVVPGQRGGGRNSN